MCATEETETEEEGVDVSISAATFPDENFRKYVTEEFDENQNGILSTEEIKKVTVINLNKNNKDIKDLKGIGNFYNLSIFYGSEISIREFNLGENENLQVISISKCPLENIDVSKNVKLRSLTCSNCNLEDINISNNL